MTFKLSHIVALLVIGLLAVNLSNGERVRYDNYRTYKVVPKSVQQLEVLKGLESGSDSLLFLEGVHVVDKEIKVIAAPHKVPDFLQILGFNEIQYELLDANVQKSLDSEEIVIAPRDSAYGWTAYYELDTTYQWLQSLASQYPGVVSLIEGGKTYEKRSILGVKISKNNGKKNKPGIFLEAGIHAREWIAPATATYIINQLLTSQDPAIQNIALNYDWYIIPHANPDGYVFTHTSNRMWRKTRAPYGSCYGADPNRNWDFYWNTVGASDSVCSDTYAGPSAFSEIEVKSLAEYIKSLEGKIQLYISFHAYSQYLLYPFGHSGELPENIDDYRRVFDVTVAAINKQFSTRYTGGNIYDAIYPAAGSSIDWAYANVGIKMAFCLELRPSSNSIIYGFQLPASQIIATGAETLDGIVAMVGEVDNLGYFK